jgi:rRNA maturation RNase YbeY
VLITDDAEIKRLNAEFRNIAKATDVLSFPLRAGRAKAPPVNALGDVVISLPAAIGQAKAAGSSPKEELLRLLVHGILHLLGYDHEGVSRREVSRMRNKERELLALLVREGSL